MKNLLLKYLMTWWRPLAWNLLPFGVFVIGELLRSNLLIDISVGLFFINLIGTGISILLHVFSKKWYYIFPQLIGIVCISMYSMIIFISLPDFYGAHKTIPSNIDISEPLDSVPKLRDLGSTELFITHGGQPGIYNYHVNFHPLAEGTLYIKAFEITSNDRLSGARIKNRSTIPVDSGTAGSHSGEFTIYEGDWGDKYAARIEVWFESADKLTENKIVEKNYIIEGWKR